jgi:hypothetical protein
VTEYVNPPRDIASSGQADLAVQNNFYLLEAGGDHDGSDTPSQDGLAFGGPSWIGIITGTDYSPLPCRVEVLHRMPPQVDRTFEMAAEYDLQVLRGLVTITGPLGQLPHLVLGADPGAYRCRVHVRGRDQGLQVAPLDAPQISRVNPEQHLIQLWPIVYAHVPEILYGPDAFARTYS